MASKKALRKATPQLVKMYKELRKGRIVAMQKRQARITLGPSLIRAFARNTSKEVQPALEKIDLDAVARLKGQEQYRQWFEKQLDRIAQAVLHLNTKRTRPGVHPGYKWGHSAKILNVFMQGIVRRSRYFRDSKAKRIERWLYVPLDSVVMRKLRECHVPTPKKINEIDEADFYRLQDALHEAAAHVRVSRILFDDVWPPSNMQ